MVSLTYCESCGHAPAADALFCGKCGRGFEAGPPPGSARARAKALEKSEEVLFDIRPLAVQTFPEMLLVMATLGLAYVPLWVRRAQNRYRITSQRIDLYTGLFAVRRQTIELFRVQDYEVREPFFLRLRAAGHLVVRALDPGEPRFVLRGIHGAHDVFETLRAIAMDERRAEGVRLLEGL